MQSVEGRVGGAVEGGGVEVLAVVEVDAEGCPSAPEAASTKFVNQCRVIVRARISITTRLWKSSKPEEQQHAVPPNQK